ncbi:hypothetical protein XX58_004169 [Salmonella enterica subsp. salamae]|uniref:Uncharacterized protein n=6 Tax=Salmonella enterica subsp. salamae TaxID=59202 RepID=A0A737Y236_SALER|nr:hypothetical protein [Salmonella enterica]EDQ3825269.1 hypothetical protein [Salmonella enterica subsp. salamae]EEJ4594412.1 hypothetical protein [Salmonella enterica subsp. salamae serovar 47:b:e,n,x,z15]EGY9706934.1 hypothetical protein [Salmonella enterica subsp. salamae serovar 48:d:z6]EIR0426284.1 hypothetical protein [Salmonella enterica subsp. enterica serovar London]EKR1462428.1 hypothetical protein [Salmonella enterica subsp. salamae serovar 47:b:1,5]HAE4725135.1 hypothetical prot
MGEADHVDGASRGYGFLPSAIGFPEQHSVGSVSLDGTHATALEIYRGLVT